MGDQIQMITAVHSIVGIKLRAADRADYVGRIDSAGASRARDAFVLRVEAQDALRGLRPRGLWGE